MWCGLFIDCSCSMHLYFVAGRCEFISEWHLCVCSFLWARSGSMQTADAIASQHQHVYTGQTFEQLTELLLSRLFASTADAGTWFWPEAKWQQQQADGGGTGGKRAIWACYSAALVRSAASALYASRSVQRQMEVLLCVYGDGDALMADYRDARKGSILLNEERCAGAGFGGWQSGVQVVVHLIAPVALGEAGLVLEVAEGEVALSAEVEQQWQQGTVVHRIMLDLLQLWIDS